MKETARQRQLRLIREQNADAYKIARHTTLAFAAIWVAVLAVSLGFAGLIAWAIVRLVLHFT